MSIEDKKKWKHDHPHSRNLRRVIFSFGIVDGVGAELEVVITGFVVEDGVGAELEVVVTVFVIELVFSEGIFKIRRIG